MRVCSNIGAQKLTVIYNIGAPTFSIISQNAIFLTIGACDNKRDNTVYGYICQFKKHSLVTDVHGSSPKFWNPLASLGSYQQPQRETG